MGWRWNSWNSAIWKKICLVTLLSWLPRRLGVRGLYLACRPVPAGIGKPRGSLGSGIAVRSTCDQLGRNQGQGVGGNCVWEMWGDRLVLCPGAWVTVLLGKQGKNVRVMRQVAGWTKMEGGAPKGLPVFFFDTPEGYFYGMRAADQSGVKMAQHYVAPELETLEGLNGQPCLEDAMYLDRFARKYKPGLCGPRPKMSMERMEVCRYTLTLDRHFLLGELPGNAGLVHVAAGMSGHCFKFAPVIGEMVAAGLVEGKALHEMFSVGRV